MAPRIVDKAAKRQQLVEAAVAVFSAKGFQGSTMADVATQADVAKGTLYQYFDSKEDLFYACFEWLDQLTLSQADAAMQANDSARDKLLTLARVSVVTARQYIQFFPLTLEVWAAASSGAARERFAAGLRTMYLGYRRLIEVIIRQGQTSGEFRADVNVPAVAAMLTGSVDGMLLQYWFDRSIDVEAFVLGFLDAVLRGLDADTGRGDGA